MHLSRSTNLLKTMKNVLVKGHEILKVRLGKKRTYLEFPINDGFSFASFVESYDSETGKATVTNVIDQGDPKTLFNTEVVGRPQDLAEGDIVLTQRVGVDNSAGSIANGFEVTEKDATKISFISFFFGNKCPYISVPTLLFGSLPVSGVGISGEICVPITSENGVFLETDLKIMGGVQLFKKEILVGLR